MVRLFVALKLPQRAREQLVPLQYGLDHANWVLRENMHLTLRFIGQIRSESFDDIFSALRAVRSKPVPLKFSDVGHFSRGSSARAVWVGVHPSKRLVEMRKRIEKSLSSVGPIAAPQKYIPHVTIAYLQGTKQKHILRWLITNASFSTQTIMFSEFALYESYRSRKGPTYHILETFPLNGCMYF